ncbi:unnamed protein product, partial [Musa acuminata var. zebrina]
CSARLASRGPYSSPMKKSTSRSPVLRCVFSSVFFYFLSKAFLHTDPVRLVDVSYNLIEISIAPHLRLRDLPLRLLEMLEITKFRVVIQIYNDTERQHVPHTSLRFEETLC